MKGTVLVIGSEGFIGKHLVKYLEEIEYEVIHFDKKLSPNQDTLYINKLPQADYVINLASLVGLKYCLDSPINAVYQNVLGVTNILEILKEPYYDCKLIHISTWAVKGKLVNPYDVTKLAGENMVMSYIKRKLINGCICRLGTTFGPGMSKLGVIPAMLDKAKKGLPLIIFGRGDQIRQFNYVTDTIKGIVTVMERGKNQEIYNIVPDKITSVNDIAKYIGGDIKHKDKREADKDYKPLDNTKIKKLGWKPETSFQDGVKEMKIYE